MPYLKNKDPEHNFMRASHWFQAVGLKNVTAQTFVGDINAPLNNAQRIAITSLFDMLWGTQQPETSQNDWNEFKRLCDPASAEFILEVPEYYGFFTYTVFCGTVDEGVKEIHG